MAVGVVPAVVDQDGKLGENWLRGRVSTARTVDVSWTRGWVVGVAAQGPVAEICANLERLRTHAGLSIQALVTATGYSRAHLYKIRNGEIVEPPGEALAGAWIRACTATDTAADAALQEFRELAAEYRNQRRRAQEQISGPRPAAAPQPATGNGDISPPVGVDVFVSYTGADEAWAVWVAAVLEAEGRTVRVQAWDSPAGTNFVGWINEQMTLAARTVAICSQAYFASHWCTQEWTGALADNTLTPLRVEDCTLPKVLATVAYRDLHHVNEPTARRRLIEAVALATPARVSGGFPGTVRAPFPGPHGPGQIAPGGPGWPLDEVRDPFALEVHHAVTATDTALPALPVYIPREHDHRLTEVVSRTVQEGASQIAVLVGGSSTGKTRACWEALAPLRASGQPWRLWHPIDPTRPEAALAALDRITPYTVIWLNEAQFYLAPDQTGEQVAAGLRDLLRTPDRGPLLILGTLWPDHWNTLTTRTGPDRHAQARELLDGHNIPVPDTFTGTDLAHLTSQADRDPRLAQAATHAHDGQITQYLAGAPVLLTRYQQASPAAQALIHAAMDARRLGAGPHLPLAWLADATPGYLTDTAWNHTLHTAEKAGVDWFAHALDYATTDWNDLPGILTPLTARPRNQRTPRRTSPATGAGRMYRLADYLDQHGRRTRTSHIPPIDFWTAAATHAHPTDWNTLGNAAWDRGLYRDATQLHKHATTHGNPHAAHALITHLHTLHPGDHRPAAHAATHAALDDPDAVAELLNSLNSLDRVGAGEALAALLARAPAAHVTLDDPYAVAELLNSLDRVGAGEQLAALAARATPHITFTTFTVAELLNSLREAGAVEQLAALAARAATYAALDDPDAVAELLNSLDRVGAGEALAALLARDPAAHVPLDNPYAVARLLEVLHGVGAVEQLAALAARATPHVPLDNPYAVAELLNSLRWVGAEEQLTRLLDRAAAHVAVDDPDAVAGLLDRLRDPAGHVALDDPDAVAGLLGSLPVAGLLGSLRWVGAEEQLTRLADRLPAAGHFDRFLSLGSHRERFRFGREPDGSSADRWSWDDLE